MHAISEPLASRLRRRLGRAWLTRALVGVVACLRIHRQPVSLELRPLVGIEPGATTGHWIATASDPQFLVSTSQWQLPRGLCRLKMQVRLPCPSDAVRIYIDEGDGFREDRSVALLPDAQGQIVGMLDLPLGLRALRIDPGDHAGAFAMHGLVLQAISGQHLLRRIGGRLATSAIAWVGAVTRLRWLLPWIGAGTAMEARLVPLSGLLHETSTDTWHAHGSDPQFEIVNVSALPRGWVRCTGFHGAGIAAGPGRLYLDVGGGFSEMRAIPLYWRTDGTGFAAEFYLPIRVHRLRYDPADRPVRFSGLCLSFLRLGTVEQVRRTQAALARRLRAGGRWGGILRRIGLPDDSRSRYAAFIRASEPQGREHHAAVQRHIALLTYRPRISIVMPVYNPPLRFLRAAVDSVRAQLYPDWELCIADDGSSDESVRAYLRTLPQEDARIRCTLRETNGGIVAASNTALDLATGEYVGFLDHDDLLSELALYYVACALNREPRPEILYTDEDKIDGHGRRFDPHFKPDWNPELLLSNNYIAHFTVYRRRLVEAVGRLSPGTDGSQDYDLILRCTARVPASAICHIPVTLYHWRALRGSTARAASAKDYTHAAGMRALRNRLADVPGVAIEDGRYPNMYRIRLPLPEPVPRVSVLIPTRDGGTHLRECLRTLRERTVYPDYEIILVDNQSRDPQTLALLAAEAQRPDTRVLRYDAPFNYSAINNFAARAARGELLLLLNDDVEIIEPDWLTEMVRWLGRPDVGIVGAKLCYPDGTIQHAGVVLGAGGVAGHAHLGRTRDDPGYMGRLWQPQRVSAVTGACMLIRRNLFEHLQGFDETHLPVAFNDIDLCLRASERGWATVWTPYAVLVHHESKTRGAEDTPEKRARFEREISYMHTRWAQALARDIYYHPAFSSMQADFSLTDAPSPWWPWHDGVGTQEHAVREQS